MLNFYSSRYNNYIYNNVVKNKIPVYDKKLNILKKNNFKLKEKSVYITNGNNFSFSIRNAIKNIFVERKLFNMQKQITLKKQNKKQNNVQNNYANFKNSLIKKNYINNVIWDNIYGIKHYYWLWYMHTNTEKNQYFVFSNRIKYFSNQRLIKQYVLNTYNNIFKKLSYKNDKKHFKYYNFFFKNKLCFYKIITLKTNSIVDNLNPFFKYNNYIKQFSYNKNILLLMLA